MGLGPELSNYIRDTRQAKPSSAIPLSISTNKAISPSGQIISSFSVRSPGSAQSRSPFPYTFISVTAMVASWPICNEGEERIRNGADTKSARLRRYGERGRRRDLVRCLVAFYKGVKCEVRGAVDGILSASSTALPTRGS